MKRLSIRITDEDFTFIEGARGAFGTVIEEVVETMIHIGVQLGRQQMEIVKNGPGWRPSEAFAPKVRPMILPMEVAPPPVTRSGFKLQPGEEGFIETGERKILLINEGAGPVTIDIDTVLAYGAPPGVALREVPTWHAPDSSSEP